MDGLVGCLGGLQRKLRRGQVLYIASINPRSKRIIWVGVAQARLLPTMSLDRTAKRVDAATRSILADITTR